MRGNSFANGSNGDSGGQRTPRTWASGYQAPRPVDCWAFMEPDGSERC